MHFPPSYCMLIFPKNYDVKPFSLSSIIFYKVSLHSKVKCKGNRQNESLAVERATLLAKRVALAISTLQCITEIIAKTMCAEGWRHGKGRHSSE